MTPSGLITRAYVAKASAVSRCTGIASPEKASNDNTSKRRSGLSKAPCANLQFQGKTCVPGTG